jgi:hypothetical protein
MGVFARLVQVDASLEAGLNIVVRTQPRQPTLTLKWRNDG